MKRKSTWFLALVLPLLGLITACSDNDTPIDQIVIADNVSEVVFTPEKPGEQTISFTSNAPWKISVDKNAFMKFTPSKGDAGTVTVTIQPFEPIVRADIKGVATITAGTAVATFNIIQIASTFAEEIRIVTPQNKLPLGQTMALAIKAVPEGGVIEELVQWSSSAPSVLSVDGEGKVTALAVGTAMVTAVSGSLSAQCALEVTEVFMTDGTGESYTFERLSKLVGSGVEAQDDSFVVTSNIIIAAKDKLVLGDGEKIKIADDIEMQIQGQVDFTPETPATIMAVDETAVPQRIYFADGEEDAGEGGGEISNVTFTGVAIRYFGNIPLTIKKCTFTEITGKNAAINLGAGALMTVAECRFIENSSSAIAGGSNMTTPLIFQDNYLYKNSQGVANKPQINVTVAGDGKVEIKGNTVIGPGEITKNGGIAVANLLGLPGTNEVLIEGNKVSDCRYGITTNGTMDVRIINNVLENNKWESNPMNGGSGVSIYNSNGGQKVYMSGNTITGHLWGITNIGNIKSGKGPLLNVGNNTAGADYNPGGNIFKNNGNGGQLYDLYNNSPLTVFAQGNTWNVTSQTQENIEQVIFHKVDDPTLGEVIFMPANQ
ncbi:MAG: Ig-like domain-containing protein [Alistipes sp.]